MNPILAEYESAPYSDGGAFPATHPPHLAAVAALLGLAAPDVRTCRVLELGCGEGRNLLPMAEALPDARFVGIDLSPGHITGARELAAEAGIRNVELQALDLCDYRPEPGTFDYVIAHGVFSWVPDEVKGALLALAARALSPAGVAYVSYNCYPGWGHRQAIRELLRMHSAGAHGFEDRLASAAEVLDFLDDALAGLDLPHARHTREHVRSMRDKPAGVFFHDELGEVNDPCYFLQFVEWAGEHGLGYLSDAFVGSTLPQNLPPPARAALERLRLDPIRAEQYADFLLNRMFRSSLLCRSESLPDRRLTAERVRPLLLRTRMRRQPADASAGPDASAGADTARFATDAGRGLSTGDAHVAAFLGAIADAFPGFVSFEQAADRARSIAPPGADSPALEALALDCLTKDLLQARTLAPALPVEVPAFPTATPLARASAGRFPSAVNRLHETILLPDAERLTLSRLTGEHPRDHFDPAVLHRLHIAGFLSEAPDAGRRSERCAT